MKRILTFLLLLLLSATVKAQKAFRSIVPLEPVVMGEAFQVQYIIDDGINAANFYAPAFSGFRVIAGPNIYIGSATQSSNFRRSKNFVFTLLPLSTGKLIIPGATINIDDRQIKSNNTFIEVISKEAAVSRFNKGQGGGSAYFLRPGENVQEKIRQNLFLKIMVDKRSCFVGEPVLAIFKLYSRLESKSDIVKNPGFYGFTVHDMVNLADKQVGTEKVNEKVYDVHTIRKVELYPLQAGVFTIDAMEVKNKIEFSRSAVNKKTEQVIVEGVLANNGKEDEDVNTEKFENSMSTEPVTINVKPIPVSNKPASFDGAVGLFSIAAKAVKNKATKNEGDVLEITISGKGNFVQLNPPVVDWPAGMEGFEPSVKDSLQKTISPLTGSRTYRYAFTTTNPGTYIIPAISFSFFNPDTGSYKTINTAALKVNIDNNKSNSNIDILQSEDKSSSNRTSYLLIGAIVLSVIGSLIWFLSTRKTKILKNKIELKDNKKGSLSVEEVLASTALLLQGDNKQFYYSLRQSIWIFFATHFNLSGSEMSKENIIIKMKEKNLDMNIVDELQGILQQSEAGLFTNVNITDDKVRLLSRTKEVLEAINKSLL